MLRTIILILLVSLPSYAGYLKQRTVTLNHLKFGASDATNFPYVICLNGATNCSAVISEFAVVGSGGLVQNTSSLTFGGRTYTVPDDLVLSSTPCNSPTLMNWEIGAYTSTTGSLIMYAKAPTASHTVDTLTGYICYDNSAVSTWQGNITGTWSPYVYVNHGNDGTTAFLYDSSPTAATISAVVGSLTTNTSTGAPPIAMGNGEGDIDNVSSVDFTTGVGTFGHTTSFTMEAWVYWFSGTGGNFDVAISQGSTTTAGKFFFYFGGDDAAAVAYYACLQKQGAGNDCVTGGSFTTGVWVHQVMTGDGTTLKAYVNGASAGSTAYSAVTTATDNTTGFSTGGIWTGVATANRGIVRVDEWRIINGTAMGADYVTASYNSTNNPSTFVTIGAATTVTGAIKHKATIIN